MICINLIVGYKKVFYKYLSKKNKDIQEIKYVFKRKRGSFWVEKSFAMKEGPFWADKLVFYHETWVILNWEISVLAEK